MFYPIGDSNAGPHNNNNNTMNDQIHCGAEPDEANTRQNPVSFGRALYIRARYKMPTMFYVNTYRKLLISAAV